MTNDYIEKKNWFSENANKRGRILGKNNLPSKGWKREDGYTVCPSSVFLLSSQATARLFPPEPPWIFSVFSRCLNTLSFLAASFSFLLQEWQEGSCEQKELSFCLCCVLLRSCCFHSESWGFLDRYVRAYPHAFTHTCLLQEGLWFRRTHNMYVTYVCCLQTWHKVNGNLEEPILR